MAPFRARVCWRVGGLVQRKDGGQQTELTRGVKFVDFVAHITEMTVELIHPIALEDGQGFAIREGGRTVGSGTVTKIIE